MEEAVIGQVRRMCDRLAKYYWSPEHPSVYTITENGGPPKGIGVIAHKNYGAFNLAWTSCDGQWKTVAEQTKLVTEFTHYQGVTAHLVNDVPLADWLCLMQPRPFSKLIGSAEHLHLEVRHKLFSLAHKAIVMQG